MSADQPHRELWMTPERTRVEIDADGANPGRVDARILHPIRQETVPAAEVEPRCGTLQCFAEIGRVMHLRVQRGHVPDSTTTVRLECGRSMRRWLKGQWILTFLTVVASAELTARVEDYLRLGVPLTALPNRERDLVLHDAIGIRGRPNGVYKKWHLNSFGFRGPEVLRAPAPGCTRILVLGASETFGFYESDRKEYPAQLEATLDRHGCYEVLNAAVAGLTVRGLERLWTGWGSQFGARVVVVYPTPGFYLANSPPDYPGPPPASAPRPRAGRFG